MVMKITQGVKTPTTITLYDNNNNTMSASFELPALEGMINETNDLFKCHAVFRMHGDRASELTGPSVKAYFRPKGVRITEAAGYEPNASPRAESASGVIKTRARVMLSSLGSRGRTLWPAAAQHACWCLRGGSKHRKVLAPASGYQIAVHQLIPGF